MKDTKQNFISFMSFMVINNKVS